MRGVELPRRFFLVPKDGMPPVIELTEIGYLMLYEQEKLLDGTVLMLVESPDKERLASSLTHNSHTMIANTDGSITHTWETG